MIKKRTAIFFLLLANIVILAHAVIPHHHHENQICVEINKCQTNCDAHQHSISQKDCHHQGQNNSACCVLKQVVYLPSNHENHDFKCLNSTDKHLFANNFLTVLNNPELFLFAPKTVSKTQIQLKNSFQITFVSASVGLRAPPVV